jgi:acyl-coenzyme A thioesterase PaaI-like protein
VQARRRIPLQRDERSHLRQLRPMSTKPVQDQMIGNYCWGCGADNPAGLHLKSYWDGEIAVAEWIPGDEYAAGPRHFLNGGIIATLLDCHGVCTAIARAYQREARDIGTDPEIWYATTSMSVEYQRPVPINSTLQLSGRILAREDRITTVECVLSSDAKDRARASVRSIPVPDDWRHGNKG